MAKINQKNKANILFNNSSLRWALFSTVCQDFLR